MKVGDRMINNFHHADDTVLMAGSEEELQKLTDELFARLESIARV